MPDRPIVVVNTTPIIGLSAIGHLWLLERIYGRVTIPTAVRDEVLAGGGDAAGVADLATTSWIQVQEPDDPAHAALLADLDRGEAAAIVQALELRAGLAILDEHSPEGTRADSG